MTENPGKSGLTEKPGVGEAAKGRPGKVVKMRSFSMEDGLPSNSIAMISTDKNGLVWIATWNGLCNYDGYRFNTFAPEAGKENVLHGNRLFYVMPAENGDVWGTTFDNRLFLLDAQKRQFVNCDEQLEALKLDNFRVQYMQRLADGSVWIQGINGVNLIAQNGRLVRADKPFKKNNNENFVDSRGREWKADSDGTVTCLTPGANGVEEQTYECRVPEGWTRITIGKPLMLEDRSGTLWFLLNGKTVCYFDESKRRLEPVNLREVEPTLPNMIDITHPLVDEHKNLWFRSRFSLCLMSFGDNKFQRYPIVEDAEIRALFVDTKKRLWVGTKRGYLAQVDNEHQLTTFLGPDGVVVSEPVIFDAQGVYAVHEDRHNNFWIGTRGNGLYRLRPEGGRFVVEHFENPSSAGDSGYDHIYDIKEDATGRIWFATYGAGIMYYDEASEGFVSAENSSNLRLQEGNIRRVRRIETAEDGTLVFSTTEGIITLDPNFKEPYEIRLYVTQYSSSKDDGLLAPDVLQTLICKHSPATYVATVGGALQNIKSAKLLSSPLQFGVVDQSVWNIGNIRGMTEDGEGDVWIVGENVLHWLESDGKTRRTFTKNDFIGNIQFTEVNPIYDSNTGNIVVGTLDGLIYFSPSELESSSNVPPIVFTGIQYQGEETPTSLIGNGEVMIPVDCRSAIIYFSALDYEDNVQIRYAYRIKGLDDDWSYVGKEHCVSLSNLPAGNYVLEVRSTNNEGVWVDNNAELPIYVEPTFWQTPQAWILYVLGGALVLYLLLYMFGLRKAHMMEKELKEKQLLAFTNISHQLRTPLTLIGGPVTEVLKTERLSDKAERLLTSVQNNANRMLELVNRSLRLDDLQMFNEDVSDVPAQTVAAVPIDDAKGSKGRSQKGAVELTILVVEDNEELRYLLKSSLSAHYNIIEAENGKVGLRMAAECQPDFIITDIMMPEMDGITMIRQIKGNESICHIPIIILSARTADAYRIEGLKEGADDYITKPFSMSYLQARVESIIHQRETLQEEWRRSLTEQPSAVQSTEPERQGEEALPEIDRNFVKKVTEYIGEHISNSELKIDEIALAMGMSRTVFYGKVKAIYGLSPSDMLRSIRIARARTILRNEPQRSVAEVALAVGYNDSKHFARNFKEIVGVNPSVYRKGGVV